MPESGNSTGKIYIHLLLLIESLKPVHLHQNNEATKQTCTSQLPQGALVSSRTNKIYCMESSLPIIRWLDFSAVLYFRKLVHSIVIQFMSIPRFVHASKTEISGRNINVHVCLRVSIPYQVKSLRVQTTTTLQLTAYYRDSSNISS